MRSAPRDHGGMGEVSRSQARADRVAPRRAALRQCATESCNAVPEPAASRGVDANGRSGEPERRCHGHKLSMPRFRPRASGRMARAKRERLVRQLREYPHGTEHGPWTRHQSILAWLAYGYATGELRFHWWPIHVMMYELAPPHEQRELEHEYVELSRTDQWAWYVVHELHRLGYLELLPARPGRGRGRPRKDGAEAANLVIACGILVQLGLAKADAEEVLGHWLEYPDESAPESVHKRIMRDRRRARKYLKDVQPGSSRAP